MRGERRPTTALALLALISLSCGALRASVPARSPALEADASAVVDSLARLHTGLGSEEIADLAGVIVAESRRAGFSPGFVVALIEVESSGNSFAVSRVGALGLMQLRPATGKAMAREMGLPWRGRAMLFDPMTNVRLGIRYLESLVERWGNIPMALAAYNYGPTRIARLLRQGGPIPTSYSERVLAAYGLPAETALRPT